MVTFRRLLDLLVRPHPRFSSLEQSSRARLFATLMLAQVTLLALAVLAANASWVAATGETIWDDLDLIVVAVGAAVTLAAYGILRAGYLRTGIILYLAATAATALIAPFVPDPDAEISILVLAIAPVLLASVVFSARVTLAILAAEVAVAGFQLLSSHSLTLRQTNSGFNLLLVIATFGVIVVVLRQHALALEADRVRRIQEGHDALLRSEQERRFNEERYHWLFETITDGIFVADASGRFAQVNEAACRQLGYSRDELLGMSIADVSTRSEADRARLFEGVRKSGRLVFETAQRRKDGSTIPVELAVAAIDLQGGPGYLGVSRDLTERRRGEADRARLREQLHHAMKMESIGRLAGGVAHDFNNLLTAILGNVELALLEAGHSAPLRDSLEAVRSAGRSAATLTRQLLVFSRKQVTEPRSIDLNALIEPLRSMLGRLIGEDVHLTVVPGENLWPVEVDPDLIEQAVVNLVVNARDAMPQGGQLALATGNIVLGPGDLPQESEVRPGDFVYLAVSDTGTGISDEAKPKLFEPFYTTKPRGKGTGLGLATVWGAVTQSGGYVGVETEVGRGSTFRIFLPRAAAAAQSAARPALEATPAATGETILLVEDADAVRATVAKQLRLRGYAVLEARGGSEALARAAEAPVVHLLLTDIIMPEMHGRELANRFLVRHPRARVQFMSGYPDDEIISRQGVLDPGTDLLMKPFTGDELARRVRATLDGSAKAPPESDGGRPRPA